MAEVLACRKSGSSKGPAASLWTWPEKRMCTARPLHPSPAGAENSRLFVLLDSRPGETTLRRGSPGAAVAVAKTARRSSLKPVVSTPPGQSSGEFQEFLAVELAVSILIELKCLLDELIRIRRATAGTTVSRRPRTSSSGPAAEVAPARGTGGVFLQVAPWLAARKRCAKSLQFVPGYLVIAIGVSWKDKLLDEGWDFLGVECSVPIGVKPAKHLIDAGWHGAVSGACPPGGVVRARGARLLGQGGVARCDTLLSRRLTRAGPLSPNAEVFGCQ